MYKKRKGSQGAVVPPGDVAGGLNMKGTAMRRKLQRSTAGQGPGEQTRQGRRQTKRQTRPGRCEEPDADADGGQTGHGGK